jgi:hypothetical protein
MSTVLFGNGTGNEKNAESDAAHKRDSTNFYHCYILMLASGSGKIFEKSNLKW